MQIPKITTAKNFSIPVFGLGTWLMGGTREPDFSEDINKYISIIRESLERGVTLIDTAKNYANGHTEEIIGKAISGYPRERIFLVSKIDPPLEPDRIIKSCQESLLRLKTNYLDTYLLHSSDHGVPIEKQIKSLISLKKQGLIRAFGVSNFSIESLKEAMQYTDEIVLNQVHYNLIIREVEEKGMLRFCQENDIILQAYRPLQKGILLTVTNGILKEMCEKYHATPAQIALNWLISQRNVAAISRFTSLKHLKDNLGAFNFKMEEKDIERLRTEFPNQKKESDCRVLS